LDTFPTEAERQLDFVDEIWTPSRFVADGAVKIAAGRPVRVMTPAIPVPTSPPNPRARFGLDPAAFVILFAFDAGSVFERKNPFALVEAVRHAFRRDDRVTPVFKVSNGSAVPDEMSRLRSEVASLGGRTVEGFLPRTDTDALLAACDCYASLHRAEGFGFTLAEAMLLGKPTVATGYSGNLDFMTAENSFPVRHRLVELGHPIGPYPTGAVWAEPDVGHAAELLRHVFEHRDETQAVGLRAKRELESLLDPTVAARRIASRLREIPTRPSRRVA
jgi:glycosyltransferase involved in cell wall biosynthesis